MTFNRVLLAAILLFLPVTSALPQRRDARAENPQRGGSQPGTASQSEEEREKRTRALVRYAEGQRLEAEGDYAGARAAYEEAIKLQPDAARPHVALGMLHFSNRNLIDAEREAREALRLDKDDPEAHRLMGRIYFAQALGGGAPDKAKAEESIKHFEQVVKADSRDAEAWALLGDLYSVTDKKDKALQAFRNLTTANPSSSAAFNRLANIYFEDYKYRDAAEAARRAYDLDPNLQNAVLLSEALKRSGRTSEAVSILKERLEEINPQDQRIYYEMSIYYADALISSGEYNEAIKTLDGLLSQDKKNIRALSLKAEAQRRAGQRKEAIETLTAALEGQDVSESLELVFKLAEVYEELERPDDAIKTYEEALAAIMNPDGTVTRGQDRNAGVILRRIGLVYRQAGQRDKAIATFERMRKLPGNNETTAEIMIIDTLQKEGNHKEAAERARASAQRFPTEQTFKYLEAQSLGELNKVDDAVSLLKGLLNGSREDADVYQVMAGILMEANRLKEAEAAIRQSVKIDPDDIGYLVTLSSIQDRAKQYKESEATLRRVLQISPDNATALNNLGYFLSERNERLDEALELIQRAVNIDPTNGSFLDSLGWVYYQMGNLEQAKKHLEQAIIYERRSSTIFDHLGDLYKKLGRIDDARKQWQKALELSREPEEIERLKKKLKEAEGEQRGSKN